MWGLTRAHTKGMRRHSGLDFTSFRKSNILDSSKTIVEMIRSKVRSCRNFSASFMVSAQESSCPARIRSMIARGSGDAATKIVAIAHSGSLQREGEHLGAAMFHTLAIVKNTGEKGYSA